MKAKKKIKKIARAVGGAALGSATALQAVSALGSVAGLSGAGMTSGLAAIGSVVGGGMAAGIVVTGSFPVVGAIALGCKLKGRNK
jgi:hypothetical protein